MTAPTQHLTVRVPEQLRDADGVRLDAMLVEEGMSLVRELPRAGTPAGWVDLLVEDTSAPPEVRGQLVTLHYDEIDTGAGMVLSFDRWELIEPDVLAEQRRNRRVAENVGELLDGKRTLGELSEDELLAELARRRSGEPTG